MIKLHKYRAAILLIFALFAINGAEFLHHHSHDEQTHASKCEACILNYSLKHVIVESCNCYTPVIISEFSIEKYSSPLYSSYSQNYLKSRAPPSV